MLRSLVLALALAVPALAQAPPGGWPAPGDGFDWQPLGDVPADAKQLAFDGIGRLWAASTSFVKRLDSPDDPSATWTFLDDGRGSADRVLPLGAADTVLISSGRLRRSLDGGATWAYLEPAGQTTVQADERMVEVPAGTPDAFGLAPGDLLGADRDGLWISRDRSDSWTRYPFLDGDPVPFWDVLDVLVLPPGHAREGHVVAAMIAGGYVSDTTASGTRGLRRGTGHETETALEHLALLPSGRILATGYRVGSGRNSAFYSDDAGESWTEAAPLPEPSDGIPGDAWLAVIGSSSALAAGGRGVVYRTDDAGETWSVVGRVPITETNLTSQHLLIDDQGRLLVAVRSSGDGDGQDWVYRTALPVTVADAAAPSASPEVGVTVSPNPSAGRVTVSVALPAAGAARVEVYDAVGRRVAVLHEGAAREALSLDVDTSAFAIGTYRVVVTAEGARTSRAFTKAR